MKLFSPSNIIKKSAFFCVLIALFFSLSQTPVYAALGQSKSVIPDFNLSVPLPEVKGLTSEQFSKGEGLGIYIAGVYKFAIAFAAIAAMLVLVYGGVLWLTARGDSGQVGESKKVMVNAVVGLVLALGSYTFLWVFNPRLVSFKPLEITGIDPLKIKFEQPVVPPALDEPLPDAGTTVGRVNALIPTYKQVAQEMGVPWELLATLHYQESNNMPGTSLLNGKALCNNEDNSRCSYCDQGETQLNDAKCAALLMKQKARESQMNLSNVTPDDHLNPRGAIAQTMFGYNGRCPKDDAGRCLDISRSPYIMNKFSSAPEHQNMSAWFRKTSTCTNCNIRKNWKNRDGALRSYMRFKNMSNFDGSGKLISMN